MITDVPIPDYMTFTYKELRETVSKRNSIFDTEVLAREILNNRDPDIYEGDIVVDANYDLWQFASNPLEGGQGHWVTFGDNGEYAFELPARPIRVIDPSEL